MKYKPGSMVWCSNYGRVRRVKLLAVDDCTAFVREGDNHYTTTDATLFDTKGAAISAAVWHRAHDLKQKIKRLNEMHAEVQKLLTEVVQSLDAGEGDGMQ